MSPEIVIESWHPDFKSAFFELNRAWIEKDYPLEPVDIDVLSNPEQNILSVGGSILAALSGPTVIGIVALRPKGPDAFELTKMAVSEAWRGKGIGSRLILEALDEARRLGATHVVLYSNTKNNGPAVRLYHKLGFVEVDLEPGVYKRADIKMDIQLYP
jgi:ribosomal protein S18 acetylase RimI-like enzyme